MGIRTVHAFGNQQVQDQRFATQNDTGARPVAALGQGQRQVLPALQLVAAVGTALVLFVGGYGALNGWWQVGVLVVVTSYLKNMLSPMKTLAKLAPSFTQGAASAQRIADILDQPTDHQGTDEPLPARVDGRIELRKVGLDYGTGRGPVFTDVDLTVTPGERIALLGDNGAGKSTLLSVIGGLYRPTTGQVLLDGHSVPDVPEHWLHQQVAMVLQDTFLFSGTLADNIRYGRPDATDAEVACRRRGGAGQRVRRRAPRRARHHRRYRRDRAVRRAAPTRRHRPRTARRRPRRAPRRTHRRPGRPRRGTRRPGAGPARRGPHDHRDDASARGHRAGHPHRVPAPRRRPGHRAARARSGRPVRHRHPPGHPRSHYDDHRDKTREPSTRRTKSSKNRSATASPPHGRRGGAAGAPRRDQGASQGRAQGARRRPEGGHPDAGRHPPAAFHPSRLLPHPRPAGHPAGLRRAGLAGPPARRGERHPVDTQRAATTARRPAAGVDRGPGGRRRPDRAGPARRP